MKKEEILKPLLEFYSNYELEMSYKEQVIDFINNNNVFIGKKNKAGHLTASAWVVNKDRSKTLLTFHRKLEKWIQLGGHIDDNEDIMCAALREAKEESGLKSLKVLSNKIFDLDIQGVPRYENEKEHFHFDIRFIFEADDSENIKISNESKDVRWILLNSINDFNEEESIKRMVIKTYSL